MAIKVQLIINYADYSQLIIYGVGTFMEHSGNEIYRNHGGCRTVPDNGPISPGLLSKGCITIVHDYELRAYQKLSDKNSANSGAFYKISGARGGGDKLWFILLLSNGLSGQPDFFCFSCYFW